MLDLAVLGLLAEQPCHGYDLRKRLSETLGPLWGISFGSLYPALRRLERTGAVEVIDADGEILGAHLIGGPAAEIIQIVSMAMLGGAAGHDGDAGQHRMGIALAHDAGDAARGCLGQQG